MPKYHRTECDCGDPAIIPKGGEWICVRCADLDKELMRIRHRVFAGQQQSFGKGGQMDWEKWHETPAPICGESLNQLEQMLKL
jgi:hypothetical protein